MHCKSREWHKKICANSTWANLFHCVLALFHSCRRNIEEAWWGAAPDTPYIFFYLYKKYNSLRGLRIFWRPRTVFQPLAAPSNIQDCREKLRLAMGIFCPFRPMTRVERSSAEAACWDVLLSLCWLLCKEEQHHARYQLRHSVLNVHPSTDVQHHHGACSIVLVYRHLKLCC